MSVQHLRLVLAGLLLASLWSCDASSPDSATADPASVNIRLQQLADAFAGNGDFSGVVAIARNGELRGHAAVGRKESGDPYLPDLDTSFHIASVSKTFTAAAIRALVSDGLLAMDDTIADHLADYPSGELITIRQLLDHQSGIPDYWKLADVSATMARSPSTQELVRWLAAQPLAFEPGSQSAYSNSGYAILAAVIESVARQPYHTFLEKRVYPSAGLQRTSAYNNDADVGGRLPDFKPRMSQPSQPYDPAILVGAGSLKSTANDLLRWCDAFLTDYLDAATPKLLHGWGVRQENGRQHAEQTGRNPGFSAHIRAYPDARTCVVVLSNLESEAVTAIGAGAAAIAFGDPVTLPELRQIVDVPEGALRAIVGRYEIAPGEHLEVKYGPEGLLLRGNNGPFLPLEPLSNDRFFYRQLYTSLTAERDDSGRVEALLWGGNWKLDRID